MIEKISNILPSETLAAFDNDSLRARIFYEKYALRNGENEPVEKIPAQMWKRLAGALASVETSEKRAEWERNFLWLLSDFKFVPGGRILHAIGNPNKVTALNCYVIPSPHDSLPGIYKTALELAETFKRGGGCGVDISTLRPKDSPAHNAARVSTGAVSFMELYSLTTGIIGQQGRRGALMITISDSHPDVLDFCKVKRNRTSVRYANISVRVTDAFMRAVEQDDEWLLHYENPEDGIEVKRTIQARELWNELTVGARDWAEPGCLFWDTIRRYSSSDRYPGMEVVSTNPCAEEPLSLMVTAASAALTLRHSSMILTRRMQNWMSPPWKKPLATASAFSTTCFLGMKAATPFNEQEEAAVQWKKDRSGRYGPCRHALQAQA